MGKYIEKVSNSSEKDIFISIFDFAAIGIIVSNQSGKILLANQYAEKLFGYDSKELEGREVEDLIPNEARNRHIQHRQKYNSDPHVRIMGSNLDLQGLKKNGDKFYLEVSLGFFKTQDNTYVMAFVYDVSNQKEAELEILERNKAIEQYSAEIKALNENLEEQIKNRTKALLETLQHLETSKKELEKALSKEKELGELKSRFVSMASHEFRTPLSTILSSIQLISKYHLTEHQEKREKHIQRIVGSVNHLNDILEEFLSVGRLEEGKIKANFAEHDLETCFHEVTNEMQNIAKQGQKIEFSHTGDKIVVTDCSILKKILINLLSNAIKFSPENSTIIIKSVLDEQGLIIQVTDNGIGISQKDQKHLFERFFRAENAINIKGTGLGLHIVAKFVEMLHGDIFIDSELGKGTTVTLHFNQ
ncbi:MAG: PAS domain-containing sensor histidine kinase [Raineya sp.]|jgi:PAS domain S-box-containing protein|nr:PAS domain-containing sensor histidine kinase [Raineya sp.]